MFKVRCSYCGRKNDSEDDLCKSCGAFLPEVVFSIPQIPNRIIHTGTVISFEHHLISGSFGHVDFYEDYTP